ncbi:MAG: hypothetical protein ACRCX2_21010 [Paraclostridium sp.]
MISKIKKISKDLKKYSNYLERRFLSKNLDENDLSNISEINKILGFNYSSNDSLEEKINYKTEQDYSLELMLEGLGVLYFLNLICKSPIRFSEFLGQLSFFLKTASYKRSGEHFSVSVLGKEFEIEFRDDMRSVGKFLDGNIMINDKLIIKEGVSIKDVILHELLHLVLLNTGLQKELDNLFDVAKIDELLADVISKNWNMFLNKPIFENNDKRIEDFELIKAFITTNTSMQFENLRFAELGSGNCVFTSIVKSHGLECLAIDKNKNLDSIKQGFAEYGEVESFIFKEFTDVVHSSVFMYLSDSQVDSFFLNNHNRFNCIFISYNTERSDNSYDEDRVSFFTESFFIETAKKYGFVYIELLKNKKRILCKKEVLLNGS